MRTRLSTEQRREQLLRIGVERFAQLGYDEVLVEEVAQLAGVSRGLMYHYFPNKRDFFLEVVRTERDRLLRASEPDATLPVLEQLHTGLDVYLDFARTHPDAYRVVHRAANNADREIRQIREVGLATNRDRILTALGTFVPIDDAIRLAVRGWLNFVMAIVLDWLDNPTVPQSDLRALCSRTLFAAVDIDPADLTPPSDDC